MTTKRRTAPDLREASDTYAFEVCRQGLCRVIRCPDGLQWIVQTASKTRPEVWQGKSFCTTRKALIREWLRRSQGTIPEALERLPERVSQTAAQTPQTGCQDGISQSNEQTHRNAAITL